MARTLNVLDQLEIASPCSARWESMTGDEQSRFCSACEKNVYNLSAMTAEEAVELIEQKEGALCIRLYLRADGTAITADCPVGLARAARRSKQMVLSALALAMSIAAGALV
jgi:hypothetical protein